jgi:hypothetical protein
MNYLVQTDILKLLTSAAANVASKDPTRWHLTFTRLSVNKTNDQLVDIDAVNGFTMVRMTVNDIGLLHLVKFKALPDANGFTALYLSKDNMKYIETLIKLNKRASQVILNINAIGEIELSNHISWPCLEAVTPKDESMGAQESISFNTELLVDISKVIKAATVRGTQNVKIRFHKDATGAIKVNAAGELKECVTNLEAILMPLRG